MLRLWLDHHFLLERVLTRGLTQGQPERVTGCCEIIEPGCQTGQYLQDLPHNGLFRDTLYRYQTARDAGGVEALFSVSRRKPNLKNRVDEATEAAVLSYAVEFPAYGDLSPKGIPVISS